VTTDIFIRTYSGDAAYHQYCLESIDRFCTGFRNTVVVSQEDAKGKGYLAQQVTKLHADQYTDADMILVTDSDTLFIEPVTPESFMRDGKPMWFMTPFDDQMLAHPGTRKWFEVMSGFLGADPTHEFMRRQPFMFPREVLPAIREFCWTKFGRTLEQYIMESGAFSEWNALGYYCRTHHYDKFTWIDTTVECPPPLVRQFWSRDPITKNLDEIHRILQ
jgi:hypothetical protein